MTIEAVPAPPPAPPEPLRPVSTSERVETIDILRGLALFGILAANIRGFSGPPITYMMPHLYWTALHDRIAQAFIDTFVQGKFITIFAFLFGVGFAVQFDRAAERGAKFGWTYARRLFVLLLFGLVHGLLIWFGDILLTYALAGFLLLLFRKRRNKTLVVWAVILLSIIPLMMTGVFIASQFGAKMPDLRPPAAEIAKAADVYENGTWPAIQSQRAADAVRFNWGYFLAIAWMILGLFLLGVLAWRKRFFRPAPESLPRYRAAMRWGLALGVIGNVVITIVHWFHPSPMPTNWLSYLMFPLQAICVPALSLGYVCAVILLCHDPLWRARLHRFAAVGRTALTNYLLQAVLGTLIFYNYGLGFFGAGPAVLLPLTVVLFALLLYASSWWVARYRFGPVEWLWRRLTYGGPLPMRREKTIAAPEQVPA
jgi:uncharacterized protein